MYLYLSATVISAVLFLVNEFYFSGEPERYKHARRDLEIHPNDPHYLGELEASKPPKGYYARKYILIALIDVFGVLSLYEYLFLTV